MEAEGQDEKWAGKSKRKSAKWKTSSENNVGAPIRVWEPFQNIVAHKRMRKELRGTAVAVSTAARMLGEDAFTGITFKT